MLLLGVSQWVWIGLITAFVLLAVAALARRAIDAGAPGRDVVYGHGIVAQELRHDPLVVKAALR
ncbi:MAG: hypothetical protein ACJ8G7_00115 [Rhizobacter sp.]